MLQVKSFNITDADGISDLLSKYRLAEGAHILVSDGHVCIPFNDGAPKTNSQKAVDLGEQVNTMNDQIALIEHSNKVLELLRNDSQKRIDDAVEEVRAAQAFLEVQPKKSKERTDAGANIDAANKKVANLKSAHNEIESQYRMNEHEVLRLKINIEMFEKGIAELV